MLNSGYNDENGQLLPFVKRKKSVLVQYGGSVRNNVQKDYIAVHIYKLPIQMNRQRGCLFTG